MIASPAITIIGLGPGDPDRRTVAVRQAIANATRILVRTLRHPGLEDLAADARVSEISALVAAKPGNTMDWAAGARIACDLAEQGERVVLAVPGHPRFGERLVMETVAEAEARSIPTTVLDGLSALDLVCSTLGIDAMVDEVQIVDGAANVHTIGDDAFGGGLFPFTPRRPMLISRMYTPKVMAGMQRLLLRLFPGDHPVTLVDAAGIAGEESLHAVPLSALGDEPGGMRLSLFVPAMETLEAGRDPRTMQHISARLRAPEGCPWDREQTHQSLRNEFLDEVYEVLDAIDAEHPQNLAEELGDIFLHIVLQAQIAEEAGEFTLEDVFAGVAAKIVRRHPHVFADERVDSPADLSRIWKRVKAEEHASAPESKLEKDADGEPRSMPALTRASRVLARHPVATDRRLRSPDERSAELLRAVAVIVQAGDDPERVLREALATHVEASSARST